MTEDFYDLLDIPSDASQDEIKDAYREQVRVYHPDLNDDDRARAQFTAVKKAYDILGDPVERQAYDRMGHKDYVAKRTSGIPSPDVWKSSDDGESASNAAETAGSTESQSSETDGDKTFTYSSNASSSRSRSHSSSSSTNDSAKSKTSGRSKTASAAGATASGGTSTSTSATGSRTTTGSAGTAGATGSSRATGTTGPTGTGAAANDGPNTGSTGTGTGTGTGTARGSAGSKTGSGSRSRSGGVTDNPLVRWWRRQNFSLPLIWLSVCLYVAGLGHFALENDAGLETLSTELRAAGTDLDAVWAVLSSGRHGLETTTGFLASVDLVAPPLEPTQWYAALAGVVAFTLAGVLGVRLLRDGDSWGPVTIDETIVVALALGVTTTLVGGPLLAGAVLMPCLFGVVVHHTRRGPGWTPSYLYVVPVLAPAAGFAAAAGGYATLPVDLFAFVLLPIAGALGLPLRATIRKHFGR
ncbi:DnaJ domain-containing protein [Natronorubrum sp. JWXQ-INN-674]|uniref:DnaJ domain-containing protein n=1 Tax=Natronorubrum halalkaliphilum TaxID=2691917 RepID=A0A6B0VQW2_9EURY|nr:DnaJ domain-containing protein [Natronorubrum halalkaliphilum]MXV63172.1 DnaJ domain-containing protein [Natronorubrum halalkaliphilum]